ncbi:MAG TPA: hypothetical protein DD716_05130 [Thiomicrospira sp.]|nr:hypothetical protein [Thiomicrospira sp.]
MSKISLIVLIVVFIGFSIAFDWFGSRDIADTTLELASSLNQKLQEAGDKMKETSDKVDDIKEAVQQ